MAKATGEVVGHKHVIQAGAPSPEGFGGYQLCAWGIAAYIDTGENYRMNTLKNEENAGTAKTVHRRTIVKGAAWSLPVILAATALPGAAASGATCPSLSSYYGDYSGYQATGLDSRKRWTSTSSSSVTAGLGNTSGPTGYAALAYSSSAPGATTLQLVSLSYSYTFHFAVNWTSVPAGWTLTSTTSSAGTWTYTFTYNNVGGTTLITSSTAPGTVVVPKASVAGQIIASSVPYGTDTNSAAFNAYSSVINWSYIPTFSGTPGCTSADGNDGTVRVRQAGFTGQMVSS